MQNIFAILNYPIINGFSFVMRDIMNEVYLLVSMLLLCHGKLSDFISIHNSPNCMPNSVSKGFGTDAVRMGLANALGWVENAPNERYQKSTSEYM